MSGPKYIAEALYSADIVKLIERQAVSLEGYELYELMQRAGLAAWQRLQEWPGKISKLTVIGGSGNNAGDGFILACHAHEANIPVEVLTVKEQPTFKGDALLAYEKLLATSISIKPFAAEHLHETDVVVDAILGTGFIGALREDYLAVIEAVNEWRSDSADHWVLALDIPSGLAADTGTVDPVAIYADDCISFIDLKPGMVTGRAREYCPRWCVADLDITAASRADKAITAWIDDSEALIHSLPKRDKSSHKGNFGHLLLIGGDYGFGGAILMAAQAAARTGVGRLTVLTRDSHVAPILSQFPEAMIRSIEDPADPMLNQLLHQVDAVVIGPGLGTQDWGKALLNELLSVDLPMLIDADGLNNLADLPSRKSNWVLTPHPGEAGRLAAKTTSEIEKNRYQSVADLQANYGGIVVLKGAGTLISNGCTTTVCNRGNPGMATAGMGDILSGIIGSLLAQGLESFEAARIGVSLHAMAGDSAAEDGEKGLLATDLLEPLRRLVND